MNQWRLESHPILEIPERKAISFTWDGRTLRALEGDTIASALFANGVRIFGRHPKDNSPQGIFCANGQCAQCMVIADGRLVKACMTPVKPDMVVEPVVGLPFLPPGQPVQAYTPTETIAVECLIIGGGPAGLSAAIELGRLGVQTLLVDDKDRLGGKLVLQTHRFFGSVEDCYAGTRGIDIAARLADEVSDHPSVTTWLNSTVTAVFSDQKVGVVRDGQAFGMTAFAAGDAGEIAEASAAMFSGKIQGLEIARALGRDATPAPPEWIRSVEILKSRPGPIGKETVPRNGPVFPVFHCCQEIPCNPCTAACPQDAIFINPEDIRHVPVYIAPQVGAVCNACEKCVNVCPGLAITLVDLRPSRSVKVGKDEALVTIAYEFCDGRELQKGESVTVVDMTGRTLGEVEVVRVRSGKVTGHTRLVKVRVPQDMAVHIAGIRIQEEPVVEPLDHYVERLTDDLIVCRCERVTLAKIEAAIQAGVRDINKIKALTRAGMGACGSKTCAVLVRRAFAELGIPQDEVTENVIRPLFIEIPLGVFAGAVSEE